MASARNEEPRGRVWEWGAPSPQGKGSGEGVMPLPNCSKIFKLKMASLGAFWELILLQLNNCLSYTRKPVSLDFGL